VNRFLQLTAVSFLMAGCSTLDVDLPAITDAPTGQRDSGRVVWHDLLTTTPEASRQFYGELFGWTFEKPPIAVGFGQGDAYMLIRHEGRLIGGMVDARLLEKEENISQWMTVISTADIEQATARVVANGGDVLTEPTVLPTRGTMGVYADASGALFAMLQSRDGDPEIVEPVVNSFLWDELWTHDIPDSVAFYSNVLGLRHELRPLQDGAASYELLKRGDTPAVGVLEHPVADARPVWANYLRVENPEAITDRVAALGGSVALEPQPRAIGGEVAVILGPSGAGIALQTWPPTENPE
jgi:predicted enzyme related to lactoylglutathione lyase